MKLYKRDYFIIAVFLAYVVLLIIRVMINHDLSTGGIELAKLQQQIKEVKAENARLRIQILNERALVNLSEEARRMGFVLMTPEDVLILK